VGWLHDHGGIVTYPNNRWALFAGDDGALHSWRSGAHVGWIHDGWVMNTHGRHVAFMDRASGGPVMPVRHVAPVRPVTPVRPVRPVRSVRNIRSVRSLSWGDLSELDVAE